MVDKDEKIDDIDVIKCVYKKLNGHFSERKYGGMKIIIMNDTGLINASKMCVHANKKYNTRKEMCEWLDLKSTKKILKILAENKKYLSMISLKKLIIQITNIEEHIYILYLYQK